MPSLGRKLEAVTDVRVDTELKIGRVNPVSAVAEKSTATGETRMVKFAGRQRPNSKPTTWLDEQSGFRSTML
jgi:hypothetical protein